MSVRDRYIYFTSTTLILFYAKYMERYEKVQVDQVIRKNKFINSRVMSKN